MPQTLTPAQVETHSLAILQMVADDIIGLLGERDERRASILVTARDFTQLHDAVDANDYLADVPWSPDDYADVNAVTERVGELLTAGRHIELITPLA